MLRFNFNPRVIRFALLLGTSALLVSTASQAAPRGHSARRAAQLKKSAPGWLSHYLPDDRYKIEGKVWKYVSTDLDTYYHRPDSPNMLRQPAERVIGFASAKDAEEAGYKPDPTDGTAAMAASADTGSANALPGSGLTPSKGGTITLSDGASTVNLPAGWTRVSTPSRSTNGITFSLDILTNPKSQGMVMIGILKRPGINMAKQLDSSRIQSNLDVMGGLSATGGRISTGASQELANWAATTKIRSASWGGLKGVSMTPPAKAGANQGNLIIVGRGEKLYLYTSGTKTGGQIPGAKALLASFRPR